MGIFTVIFSYIASVIGAGFASGQEVVSFFVRYGSQSILGVFTASVIFGLFEYCTIDDCLRYNITSYDKYTKKIMPGKFGIFTKYLIIVFSGVCFCTMAAGGGAMFSQLFGISSVWGNILICLLTLLMLSAKNHTALKYNAVLGGIIIVGIISCCIYILLYREHQAFFNSGKMIISSVSYAGYNLITAGVILVRLSPLLKSRRQAAAAGIFTSFIMFFIMGLMWLILSIYYGKINLGEMPMLTMAERQNAPLLAIYSVMLFLSILSTAVASAFGVFELCKSRYSIILLTVCAVSFGSSGFANMINFAYRICGYFGMVFAFYIIIKNLKNAKTKRIKEN